MRYRLHRPSLLVIFFSIIPNLDVLISFTVNGARVGVLNDPQVTSASSYEYVSCQNLPRELREYLEYRWAIKPPGWDARTPVFNRCRFFEGL